MTRRSVAIALTVALAAAAAGADDLPDCAALAAGLTAINGYQVSIPPAGPDDGWCVLDGATLRSTVPGRPNLGAERLRLKRSATEVELDLGGLRIAPRLGDREVDPRLRSLMRLQSIDLRLLATEDAEAGVLRISGFELEMSGGTRLRLEAEIAGADLSGSSLASGAVTQLRLDWRTDGHLARPLMELGGEALTGATGGAAVDAARAALAGVIADLPGAALDDASRKALLAATAALPQGRGNLVLSFSSTKGIGAARLAVAALSGDPFSAQSLDAILDDAVISANWQPGLVP
jgi:hypothetical protein